MKLSISPFLNLSALILGVPYFFGFVYLNAYFKYFGIDLSELGFSVQYVYVSAFVAMWKSLLALDFSTLGARFSEINPCILAAALLVVVVIVLLVVVVCCRRRIDRLTWPYPGAEVRAAIKAAENRPGALRLCLQFAVTLLIYILSLTILYSAGVSTATRAAVDDISKFPKAVVLDLTNSEAVASIEEMSGAAAVLKFSDYRLVHASPNTAFLIRDASMRTYRWLIRVPIDRTRIVASEEKLGH